MFGRAKKQPDNVPRRRQGSEGQGSSSAFQRNRTISGALSDSVYAPQTTNAQFESPRTQAQKLRIRRRRVGLLFLGAFVGIVLFYTLLTQFVGGVRVATAQSGLKTALSSDSYALSVEEYLATRPLERFRFSLNESGLEQYLISEHAEIAAVTALTGDGVGQMAVSLEVREPVASWQIGDKTYYVDNEGVAFEKNYFSGSYVKIVDESGISVSDGAVLASSRFLSFVGRVVSGSKELYGYTVTEALIPDNTTRELDIKIKDYSSRVKLLVDRPAGEQVEDMHEAIEYLRAKGRAPTYIDVRVSGKAFYK